jgi:hypothetical protein
VKSKIIISLDWDFCSGCREHVFDAPIWGSRDDDVARTEAWKTRLAKRTNDHGVFSHDFPLYDDAHSLIAWLQLNWVQSGIPCYAMLSHASLYTLLASLGTHNIYNIDSHHDLYSSSGDGQRLRPGNWAGLALRDGYIDTYACIYPPWHSSIPVGEGFDLARTQQELEQHNSNPNTKLTLPLSRITLQRQSLESVLNAVSNTDVAAIALIQSPAWCNPDHDVVFWGLVQRLRATIIDTPAPRRGWQW